MEMLWRRDLGRRVTREVTFRIGSVVGHRSHELFALVGHARTGSNYVLRGLTTASTVRVYNEPFAQHNRGPGRSFDEVMSTIAGRQPFSIRVVGFKVFYYHLSDAEWSMLVGVPALRVVHLTRRNRLRTVVSLAIAMKTDRWTGTHGSVSVDERRVTLDVTTLIRRLEEIEAAERIARRRLAGVNVFELVYEDLLADPLHFFEQVGRFLAINGLDIDKITLPRQNPEALADLIENFDDVKTCLVGSRFASYLRD